MGAAVSHRGKVGVAGSTVMGGNKHTGSTSAQQEIVTRVRPFRTQRPIPCMSPAHSAQPHSMATPTQHTPTYPYTTPMHPPPLQPSTPTVLQCVSGHARRCVANFLCPSAGEVLKRLFLHHVLAVAFEKTFLRVF